MIIERKKLLDSIQLVMPGIDSRELVESMTHLHFDGKSIVTFNDAAYVSLPFATDFKCSIHARTLFNLLKGLDSEKVKIEPTDDNKLRLNTKGIAADFAIGEGTEINEILDTIAKEIKSLKNIQPLPNDFMQAIELCAFSAHTKDIQGSLTNLKCKGDKVYSTDRTRFSCYQMSGQVDEFMFKASIVPEMMRYNLKLYGTSKSWIHFFESKNGVIFSIRKYVGDYPDTDIDKIIKTFKPSAKLPLPAEVQGALQTVSVFTEGQEQKMVSIKVSGGYMAISAAGPKGSVVKKIKVETDKEFSFSINPTFLSEILKRGAKAIEVSQEKGDPLALFKTSNFSHCIALFVS